jgi:nucleoside-diphosphate-sugar epimerase
MGDRYFITGAQGCIGSWIVKTLIERGDEAIVFDRSDDSRRLAAIMNDDDLARIRFILGDITDGAAVLSALRKSEAERVIHLAGLQVPSCKAEPVTGAQVNVVGTLNVFESARETNAKAIVYASSAAVYGINDDDNPLDETAACEPSTHYGVFKLANEGNARIYFLDHGLSSVGLRPLTVYGVNRDTGLTSDPTKAMKSAVLGRRFHIRFGGATDFQYVADTANAFIACANKAPTGAHVFNLHGETLTVDRIASFINEEAQADLITFSGPPIPIAPAMDDSAIKRALGALPSTPFQQGIRATMQRFAELRDDGRLDTSDL